MKITDIDQNFLTEGPVWDATKRALGRDWTNTKARWTGAAKGQQRVNTAVKALFAGYKQWIGTAGLEPTQGSMKQYLTHIGFDPSFLTTDKKLFEVSFGGGRGNRLDNLNRNTNNARGAGAGAGAGGLNRPPEPPESSPPGDSTGDREEPSDAFPINRGEIIKALTKVIQLSFRANKIPKPLQKVLTPAA